MRSTKKVSILLLFLLIAGLARMPLERPLGREMRQTGILAEPLDQKTSDAIGQTSAAIALGGLRSLVASVLNFSKVVPAWQEQDWVGIFTIFEQIHTLQPQVSYYYQAAAGYAADDAYSDYRDRPGMEEWQRELRRNEFFNKGITYLDEGIENLPEDLKLREMKARMLSDTYKPEHVDYAAATEVLDEAVTLKKATDVVKRQRLYLMSRVPERRREALALTREIYADPRSRFPSIKSQLFSLQNEFPDEEAIPLDEIYDSKGEIVRGLFNHYQRRNEGLPMAGVREELEATLDELKLPMALNPLLNTDIKRVTLMFEDVYEASPLKFPSNYSEESGNWPLVVRHFEEYGSSSLPTMRVLYYVLQNLAGLPPEERVHESRIFPDRLTAIRDLANFLFDESHDYPRNGVREQLEEQCVKAQVPDHLSPLLHPEQFPFNNEWMDSVQRWHYDQVGEAK
ncbi:hypothetical protein QEH58_04535 [Roseibacillus persicicus]|nr:hypothetical protein [Roseibacillus persicicus]